MKDSLRFWNLSGANRVTARIKPTMNAGSHARVVWDEYSLEQTNCAARFRRSSEFDENAYGKGGWVLYMLRINWR